MKLMIISDIHGSAFFLDQLLDRIEKEKPEKILLLGDILYHGARNDLSKGYDTKFVYKKLNELKDKIIAVRGNCDSEVDQTVLSFPMTSPYTIVYVDNKEIFLTHGHIFGMNNMPESADIVMQGHTHVPMCKKINGTYLLNPGSVSIPKEKSPNSYGILENNIFTVKDLKGVTYLEKKLKF